MAEIIDGGGGGGGGKHQKKRAKKSKPSMDMTPMVDLAFLLLTFFILATTLSKPKTMEIIYPKDEKEKDKKTKVADELATTLLLGKHSKEIFYYFGVFKPDSTTLFQTDFSKDGFRKLMLDKNKRINDQVTALKGKLESQEIDEASYKAAYGKIVGDSLAPFCVVKTVEGTKYRNVVNAIDELNIVNVKKRAIMDMGESEAIAVRQKSADLGLNKDE
jgi:biopolymer transport protein ExbD